ncbi:hypothetical protein acsn021_08590 [Anaerocolumna cellulosilytica]|uniref:Uncharacterized protein n=1 Tax=Anaerocolumna cellulosilytica TaxID=433286 RepID=A0A6S6R1V2_9FIRM|nr:DUF6063 family protein [Anaerocolumna cellulosilytica]MBB5194346.1 hypothetical protein [Anaerocolumna cellulosilytica]BCJ93290.1 hypothetical protein acsn021_08590 [Anaerocolumna cellulosilytica]
MAYEIEEIKKSQQIFYYLLKYRELKEKEEGELYQAYTENESVMNLVKSQGEAAGSEIVRYGNVIYLIPKEDNDVLGYSKSQLKAALCRSGATDKDYYLSQFVIITLLVEFYDAQGSSSKSRDFIKVGELLNCISARLQEGIEKEQLLIEQDKEEEAGLAFAEMSQAFEALRSEEKGSRAKTTKEGFIYTILNFLQKQGLIEYVEADEMIRTTQKLNHFMDFNLLNKNNYNRVLNVLGVTEHE